MSTQSLYTPVFPSLSRHPLPSSSSSPPVFSSQPNLISSLSRLHLSLASLPPELCPAEFPESEERANVHKLKIEAAFRDAQGQPANGDWSRLYKLAQMTCTRSKFRSFQAQTTPRGIDEDVPWILAETEDEWNQWETAWRQGKLKKTKSCSSRSIKQAATVREDNDMKTVPSKSRAINEKVVSWKAQVEKCVNEQGTPDADKQRLTSESKRPSPLGFLVVKPSTSTTNKKSKQPSNVPVVENSVPRPPLPRSSSSDPRHIVVESSQPCMPPPTFSQVVTSTPVKRNTKDQGKEGSPPLFFASQPSQHKPQLDAQSSPKSRPLFEPSQVSPRKEDQPLFDPATPEHIHVHPQTLPSENTRKRLRPLTPPSERDEPVQPLQTQAMFQTQIDIPRPAKRPRTRPVLSPPTTASPPATFKTPIRASAAQGPSSGEMVVIPPPSVEKGLGNAKGLFDIELNPPGMNTPEKKPPTLTELLASSQRSKPRPRPPSRKAPATPSKSKTPYRPQMLVEDPVVEKVAEQPEEQLDEIPATPKTYFSSPASSTSSSASAGTLFNLRSKQARFSPPSSPMFTQHPEAFNPTSTGTQIGEQRGRLIGEASLGRTGSLGMFGYNSQFDVDGHVDEVTAMLERDMDVDNWYKELQNHDLDVGV